MGNTNCLPLDRLWYLYEDPPAVITHYESVSGVYWTHKRLGVVHLVNDTDFYLRHRGTYKAVGNFVCPLNPVDDLDPSGNRVMAIATRKGFPNGVHMLLVFEIEETGRHLVIMLRNPYIRTNHYGLFPRHWNAFAVGMLNGFVSADRSLYNSLNRGPAVSWYRRFGDDGKNVTRHVHYHHFSLEAKMGYNEKPMLRLTLTFTLHMYTPLQCNVKLAVFKSLICTRLATDLPTNSRGMFYALVVRCYRNDRKVATYFLNPLLKEATVRGEPKIVLADDTLKGEASPLLMRNDLSFRGYVDLDNVTIGAEDLAWEADKVSLNGQEYDRKQCHSRHWVAELALKIGVGKAGRGRINRVWNPHMRKSLEDTENTGPVFGSIVKLKRW